MHIALIGASGLIGNELLKSLGDSAAVSKVTAITRRPLALVAEKIHNIVLPEFSQDAIFNLNIAAEVFICSLGTTMKTAGSKEKFLEVDLHFVIAFAKLAEKMQAQGLFVVSAVGADPESIFFYNRVKGEMESLVSKCLIPAIYFLQASVLIGQREIKRTAEEYAVRFYNKIGKKLPKFIRQKLGTEVSEIVSFVLQEIHHLKSGRNKITNFAP